MKSPFRGKRILIIDHQKYWRELSAQALEAAGFTICEFDTYNYPLVGECAALEPPDLVILGCTTIGPEEEALIQRVLADRRPLVVLSTSLSWLVAHSLFLAGVKDVADKPYDPGQLVTMVQQALHSTLPMDSYQATQIQRGGAK